MVTDLLQLSGIDYLLSPDRRIFWGYLLLALAIGMAGARLAGQQPREWLGAHIWWHASARLDYAYFIFAAVIKLVVVMPLLLNAGDVAACALRWLDQLFGYRPKLGHIDTQMVLAYGFALFVVSDLTRYALHRLMHRLPLLWAIHRVHHSAEVMTPLTFYRVHPLENFLFGLRYAIVSGTVTALFVYRFGAGISLPQIFGVNAFVLLAHLLGDNLRHSHVRLRYPAWLEHCLISPQQHQFHHHLLGGRNNYGGVLALWDWLFGSLRISRSGEQYVYGVAGETPPRSIVALLFWPLAGSALPRRLLALLMAVSIGLLAWAGPLAANDEQARVELGRALFFDPRLSLNGNQSCASCHDPAKGFSESRDNGVVGAASLGDDLVSLGDRNTPALAYASLTPAFHYNAERKQYQGGMFWDGRAHDLVEQAGQPILNSIEMAMPDKAAVVARVSSIESYRAAFASIFGDKIFADPERGFTAIASVIAAFESSPEFSSFDSKYDRYLRGEYELSDLEDLGMSIFFSTTNSNCSSCHQLKVMDDAGEPFSNYEYRNIGTPVNLALRQRNGVAAGHQDPGLAANPAVGDAPVRGMFKVPSLRNSAITGPYMHNGVFRELRTVIEFYDQYNNSGRSLNPETEQPWAAPEIAETIALEELKAKPLNERKIDALIAFLRTLTDARYEVLLQ